MTSPKALLNAWNLRAKKKLGQHFLSDPSTAEMIIARANVSPADGVLEIGAGLGALTVPAAKSAKRVFAVEKDQQLIQLLKTELLVHNLSNVEIIAKNILSLDIHTLAVRFGRNLIVIGSLPYNISSQILIQLIRARNDVQRAILMFQKELAQRITAKPGSKDYGRLTVMLTYCAEIKRISTIAASQFYPVPKVDSEVLEIKFKAPSGYPDHDEAMLFQVIKAAFGNRRKTLRNALSMSALQIDPQTAQHTLISAGIDPTRRAETLNVSEFVRLQRCIKNALKPKDTNLHSSGPS
jgi:16S rRNA (adenine1518-N6/adenine1519-N6)-dimethyltransferase